MNRNERAKAAQETLDIFKQGSYMRANSKVDCQSAFTTEFISEKQLEVLSATKGIFTPKYEVVNESVVDTILRHGSENCGVLNFASAKNPGGGFLNGSLAQEEALAVSSDLYNSQLQAHELYDINRKCRTTLYTHNMIYSHNLTFIRDGNMNLLLSPVSANVLTSPAVNAGAFYKNEKDDKATVMSVMEKRMRYILNVFADKGDRTIILGAYGCGVFKNDTADVADTFHKLLKGEQLERHFEHIVFAVYDTKGLDKNVDESLPKSNNDGTAEMQLRRLSLFSSGVGFFEHGGIVTGNAEFILPFNKNAVNDVLKSIVIADPDASPTITYHSEDTLLRTLKGLSVDLHSKDCVAELLNSLKGAEIEVLTPSPIKGRILLVEFRHSYSTNTNLSDICDRDAYVSLFTPQGIRIISLKEISGFTFLDKKIDDDVNRALDLILQSRDSDIRNLTIKLNGTKERKVSLSYVMCFL